MAGQNLTSEERLNVYRVLFQINRSFHLIVTRLSDAGRLSILEPNDIKEMLGLTQEMQLEINTLFLDRFSPIEERDHTHFGKARIAMEKRLKT